MKYFMWSVIGLFFCTEIKAKELATMECQKDNHIKNFSSDTFFDKSQEKCSYIYKFRRNKIKSELRFRTGKSKVSLV